LRRSIDIDSRHHQLQAISARGSNKGECDAGIARCRLDQHGIGIDHARLFHRHNHSGADAVLHAGGRAEIFQLGKNARPYAMHLRKISQTDDRRIADRIDNAVENAPAARWVHCTRARRRVHDKLPRS
jgi:hypothetical protein